MDLLVERISWLLDSLAKKSITISLGYDIGIPVVNVYEKVVDPVDGFQRFAGILYYYYNRESSRRWLGYCHLVR